MIWKWRVVPFLAVTVCGVLWAFALAGPGPPWWFLAVAAFILALVVLQVAYRMGWGWARPLTTALGPEGVWDVLLLLAALGSLVFAILGALHSMSGNGPLFWIVVGMACVVAVAAGRMAYAVAWKWVRQWRHTSGQEESGDK